MSSEAVAGTRLDASAAITADRYELTYPVPQGQYRELASHFDGQLASTAEYLVTTAYFDTSTRRLLAAARSHAHDHTKLRAKEYFDLRPSRPVLDASDVWLELKRRSGARTQKHRVRVSRSALERWVNERRAPAPSETTGNQDDVRVLEAYFADETEPLAPACLVNYRRRSWQSDDGQLRLTLDADLAFFAPPSELLVSRRPLRDELGVACAIGPSALLEVKHRASSPPAWLETVLERVGLHSSHYSKFVAASLAVEQLTGTC